jgi:3-hydroxyacyl-CoA dehydrogenase
MKACYWSDGSERSGLAKTTLRQSFAIGASVTDIEEAMLDLGTPMSPLRFADTSRIATAFGQLSRRAGVAGRHYAPCTSLKRISESGGKFYAGS